MKSIYADYNYEPLHYCVEVDGNPVSGPQTWEEAAADRQRIEAEPDHDGHVELVPVSRGDMDNIGRRYHVTLFRDRTDLETRIAKEGGGLIGALEAGITADNMPEGDVALRAAWQRMEAAYKQYGETEDEVDTLLTGDAQPAN